ncbi:uncharacterized protein LOC143213188 [Lasioglossum baleicum]|uniref:uncharacterized protein LOC143213188 n=1 Tax=Lasioglossum baleicum TaxID=434251 RepID=UPI003FCE5978
MEDREKSISSLSTDWLVGQKCSGSRYPGHPDRSTEVAHETIALPSDKSCGDEYLLKRMILSRLVSEFSVRTLCHFRSCTHRLSLYLRPRNKCPVLQGATHNCVPENGNTEQCEITKAATDRGVGFRDDFKETGLDWPRPIPRKAAPALTATRPTSICRHPDTGDIHRGHLLITDTAGAYDYARDLTIGFS